MSRIMGVISHGKDSIGGVSAGEWDLGEGGQSRRREISKACCGGPGRDDSDTWTRMKALEMEINGKHWNIFGG